MQNTITVFRKRILIARISTVAICRFLVAAGRGIGVVSDRKSAEVTAEDEVGAVPELTSLLAELRCITRRMRSDAEKEDETNDWKFAAMVVDRLCFCLFSVYLALLTVVFLALAASRMS